jgi:uncharacterized spore protein YtfJ
VDVNRLFDTVEKTRETADCRAAFGEPQVVEGKTVIPVAKVTYGFGLGFGSGSAEPEEADEDPYEGEGGGAGGGASVKPVGALVVTQEGVYFEETVDAGKIAFAGVLLGAFFVFQLFWTVRAVLDRRGTSP